jgi:hypothetical protein
MAVQRLLEDLGLFRFVPPAPAEIYAHFARVPTAPPPAAEVTQVSAAEFAALRWLLRTLGWSVRGSRQESRQPIRVTPIDARLALAKAICSPYYGCLPGEEGRPSQLWDAILFAGDMAKLEGLGLAGPTELRENPVGVADELELRYRRSGVDWGEQLAETGYVRLEVLLWASKMELVQNPDHAEDEIARHASNLGLGMGADGPVAQA